MRAKLKVVPEQEEARPGRPESVHELFETLLNDWDLDRLTRLYEPKAAMVERDGNLLSGSGAIAEFLRGLLSIRPRIRIRHIRTIDAGDVAVLLSEWKMTGTGADGADVSDEGRTYDIVRRQADGTWKIVVDNPWSTVLPEHGSD